MRDKARTIARVRGMRDWWVEDYRLFQRVERAAQRVAELYGCRRIETPIIERAELFERALGESSDAVSKEMYAFPDRKGRRLVLRPENTAGFVRAFFEKDFQKNLILRKGKEKFSSYYYSDRYFYCAPMFRYERPQKGRYRQFHQIGVEMVGMSEPCVVDTILCARRVLDALDIEPSLYTLKINTLGEMDERAHWREALFEYFKAHEDLLSEDSRKRLRINVFRILDSKDNSDRRLIEKAPSRQKFFDQAKLEGVRAILNKEGVSCEVDSALVRGLDYYEGIVFEFVENAKFSAQNALIAGGEYGTSLALGYDPGEGRIRRSENCVGWAGGVERLIEAMPRPARGRDVADKADLIFAFWHPIGEGRKLMSASAEQKLWSSRFSSLESVRNWGLKPVHYYPLHHSNDRAEDLKTARDQLRKIQPYVDNFPPFLLMQQKEGNFDLFCLYRLIVADDKIKLEPFKKGTENEPQPLDSLAQTIREELGRKP